ncbi:MAG: hypothetical protein FD188_3592, partial [Ignavibacteria bacterium]
FTLKNIFIRSITRRISDFNSNLTSRDIIEMIITTLTELNLFDNVDPLLLAAGV